MNSEGNIEWEGCLDTRTEHGKSLLMKISSTLTKQHLREQLQNLSERVEWLETQIQEHEMSSEIIWFINSRYKAKFFKERKNEWKRNCRNILCYIFYIPLAYIVAYFNRCRNRTLGVVRWLTVKYSVFWLIPFYSCLLSLWLHSYSPPPMKWQQRGRSTGHRQVQSPNTFTNDYLMEMDIGNEKKEICIEGKG